MHVTIKRLSDGVTASGVMDFEFSEFVWREGNFSCNCNRSLFLDEFLHPDADEFDEAECGDGGYPVRITDDAGNVLMDEIGPILINVGKYQYDLCVIVPVGFTGDGVM